MNSKKITEMNAIQKLEVELMALAGIVIIGSLIMKFTEDISYFDAVYFSIITLAGIGYGDIVPQTLLGKIVVMFYALVGLPLFITMGYLISSILVTPIKKTRKPHIHNQDL